MIIITFFVVVMATTPLDLDATQSSVDGEFYQSTYMPGSLIGNWNAETNPEGTTTLPGYWGGSGNNIIGCDITPSDCNAIAPGIRSHHVAVFCISPLTSSVRSLQ
jgi:hypothetical protein